jgi:hypothetical protein
MHRPIVRSSFVLTAVFAVLAFAAAPVAAGTPTTVHFVDHNDGSEVVDFNDCGAALPLTVFTTGVLTGIITFAENGDVRTFEATFSGADTITNTDTGLSATGEYHSRFRNAEQIDLGDGSFLLRQTTTGNAKLRGPDGTLLWHGAGRTIVDLVLIPKENAPPIVVSENVIVQHGKQADGDFCQILTAALGQ